MKNYIVIAVVSLVVGATCTKFYWPTTAYKEVEVEKAIIKTDVRTVTRIVERNDGQKETTIETTDNSVASKDSSKSVEAYKDMDWVFSISAQSRLDDLKPSYGVVVQKRILGPVFAGLSATDMAYFGLVVSLGF